MKLTRRQLVVGGAGTALGAALGGAGIYELLDRLADEGGGLPRRRAGGAEQHVVTLDKVVDNGVEVLVPPLHNEVVTATVRVEETRVALREAREALEAALRRLEGEYAPEPRGLHVTVAWGLPYFSRYVPSLADQHLPVDLRASEARGRSTRALIDAIRFPSDPDDLVLEENEVAVFFRSDNSEHVRAGSKALFASLEGLFEPTSIRRGFIGGGFGGEQSLPKKMALAAGIPGAELIPDTAELFLGFTSSQKNTMGPGRIANHETIPGLTDQHPDGYFRGGTAMHLSHIFEDLEAWFLNFDFSERVTTMIRPETRVAQGTQTIAQTEEDAADVEAVKRDARRHGAFGHSASIQPASRLQEAIVGTDETPYPKGTAIPQRADFDTLDNPFFWSSRPDVDRLSNEPAAGVHFVVFNPTSDDFHRNRLAMDGVLPDGTKLPIDPRGRGAGFNAVLNATHRQNYLVPPLRHRSFPLSELL
ncbi:MAG: hypothetical protein H0U90_01145 [Actinobacteria bacterium]|nr:hypothetical protein [Actinomycetota bacterium]